MSVVTITSQLGSGGHEIARKLANLMDYDLITKGLIRNVFRTSLLPEDQLAAIDAARPSAIEQYLLEEIRALPETHRPDLPDDMAAALLVGTSAPVSEADPDASFEEEILDEVRYQRMTDFLIGRIADRNRAVVLGRGGRPILQSRENVFHVLVVCPFKIRVERIMAKELCEEEVARERVRLSDQREERIFRDWFQTGFTDPTNYDLTVNTAHLTPRDAVSVISQALVSSLKRRR